MDAEDIENWFSFHPPLQDQNRKYIRIRAEAKAFAYTLLDLCPTASEEYRFALQALRLCVMWANVGIACAPDAEPPF